MVDEEDIDDNDAENKPDETSGGENPADDATLNTPNPGNNPDEEDMDDMDERADNPLEGSVTEDDPPENMFGDDDDEEEINPEPSKSVEQPDESGADQEEVSAEPDDANEHNQEESTAPEEFQSQEQVRLFKQLFQPLKKFFKVLKS